MVRRSGIHAQKACNFQDFVSPQRKRKIMPYESCYVWNNSWAIHNEEWLLCFSSSRTIHESSLARAKYIGAFSSVPITKGCEFSRNHVSGIVLKGDSSWHYCFRMTCESFLVNRKSCVVLDSKELISYPWSWFDEEYFSFSYMWLAWELVTNCF